MTALSDIATHPPRMRKKRPRAKHHDTTRKPRLRRTFFLVLPGVDGAVNLDQGALSCPAILRSSEAELRYHVNKYRENFWWKLNWIKDGDASACPMYKALEDILQIWKNCGFVILSQARPELESHAEVIIEYLIWQIRERGWDNRRS